MSLHLISVAAKRAALLEHATLASQDAARETDPERKRLLLRDARDMQALALSLETQVPAA